MTFGAPPSADRGERKQTPAKANGASAARPSRPGHSNAVEFTLFSAAAGRLRFFPEAVSRPAYFPQELEQ